MTLGSLFDGSGGFPLAGVLNGIKPIWASEIEPYPLRVTAARFPEMTQLGDVTKIDGTKVEPVDIITFGSPCQDLSVAGKQLGIHAGERSNLFFEAIRIIKEMRGVTNGRYPRFAVWENVPGAFSSNKGEDFRAVLQAFASVCEDGLDIPRPPKGKWNHAGSVVGHGWSVAWRVYDAQYWGVPQRRKRIYLIADFASERAEEILFECESVRGNPAESGAAGEGTAADAERGAGGSCFNESGVGYWMRGFGCLRAEGENRPSRPGHCVVEPAAFMGGQGAKARSIAYCDDGSTPTLRASPSGGNTVPDVCYSIEGHVIDRETSQNGRGWAEGYAHTLNATDKHAVCYDAHGNGDGKTTPTLTGDHQNRVTDYTALAVGNGQLHQMELGDKTGALNCMHDQQAVVYPSDPPRKYIVRRLTPTECARLQGFPDWWTDGVEGSDSAQYKMWGNGIALPCAVDVLNRISRAFESWQQAPAETTSSWLDRLLE